MTDVVERAAKAFYAEIVRRQQVRYGHIIGPWEQTPEDYRVDIRGAIKAALANSAEIESKK